MALLHNQFANSASYTPTTDIPQTITISFEDGSSIDVPGYDRVTIGRDSRSDHTTVDLSPLNATMRGVARHHVEILPENGQLTVQDLHSINGTWLNGKLLTPGQLYPLSDGDVLQLGKISMTLHFVN